MHIKEEERKIVCIHRDIWRKKAREEEKRLCAAWKFLLYFLMWQVCMCPPVIWNHISLTALMGIGGRVDHCFWHLTSVLLNVWPNILTACGVRDEHHLSGNRNSDSDRWTMHTWRALKNIIKIFMLHTVFSLLPWLSFFKCLCGYKQSFFLPL